MTITSGASAGGAVHHALYDIWESAEAGWWCAQLVNFIGHFNSEAAAQRYVAAVRVERKRLGLK